MRSEQFEAHARVEDRHWWFTARREILRQVVGAIASGTAPVADVGCGTGGNAAAFADRGHPVLGLDPSEDAIRLARQRFPRVAFQVSDDATNARSHLAEGGVLLLTDVLEHVKDDDALLDAAVSAVPVGGHLVITVPADMRLWSAHDVAFGHFRRYDMDVLETLIGRHPVTVRLLLPFNVRLYPLIALRRRWLKGRASEGGDLDVPAGPFNRLLHRIFAGEARGLVAALDRDQSAQRPGVSLMAVLRRR